MTRSRRRFVLTTAAAVAVTAAFLPSSGLGSSRAAVRSSRRIPVALTEAIHARLGPGPIRPAARRVGNPELGYRVAVSADGTTALVSAPGLSNGRGAAYVYHVSGAGSWTSTSKPTATLTNKSTGAHNLFGVGVALSADGTTAFVGAPLWGGQVGAVYVFHVASEDAWASTSTPTATLSVPPGSLQGQSVAVSSDGTTLVVGTPFYNDYAGGAFVFHVASEDAWLSSSTPAATLSNAAEPSSDSGVGGVVGISGDGTTALIGDAGDSRAYVFHVPSAAGWASNSTPTAILSNGSGYPNDEFAGSLALSGDGTTAFLGAPGVNGLEGAVDVFHAAGEDSWTSSTIPTAILRDGGGGPHDFLGGFVRASADGMTAVATIFGTGKKVGGVRVFRVADEGAWTSTTSPTAALTDSARAKGDALGEGLAISGDGATLLVGAPGFNWETGMADLFHASDASSWLSSSTPAARLTNSALPHPECVVPRLVGLPLVIAKYVIAGASCRLGKVKRVDKGKKWRGRVVAQSPVHGKHLHPGARIRVKVGK